MRSNLLLCHGEPRAPRRSVGTTEATAIWLVSPLSPGSALDHESILTIGGHEFTYAVVDYLNGSLDPDSYQSRSLARRPLSGERVFRIRWPLEKSLPLKMTLSRTHWIKRAALPFRPPWRSS